jgi:CDP-2,3-bis-(O-geranylgeranyl)-sn-glycerol synthase
MYSTTVGQFLFLLLVANGAPIIAQNILHERLNDPLDGGRTLADGRPLFGPTKTVRGLLAAGAATGCAALLVRRPGLTGVCIGLCAMGGDLISSFIKRRCGIHSSDSALGLDQSLEALVPTVVFGESVGVPRR